MTEFFYKALHEIFWPYLVENKTAIIVGGQFLLHKGASYYVRPGKKSLKGFIKFLIGKPDDTKN